MSTQDKFYSSVDTSRMDKVLSGAILYTIDTELSDEEKRIARQNIDAVSEDQHYTILGFFDTLEELPSGALTGDAYGVKNIISENDIRYDIYVWDGVNEQWVNNGRVNPTNRIVDAASIDAYHTLTSSKIKRLFNSFIATTSTLDDDSVTTNKIVDGAVSETYEATITTSSWIGEEVSEYLSPDGSSNDYTLQDKPSELIRLEFLSANLLLEPNVDYIYDSTSGTIHFRETPAVGSQTYEVVYHSTQPPYHKEVPIPGILATDKPIISVVPSKTDHETAKNQLNSWDEIYNIAPIDGGLIARASFHTTEPVPIKVLCIRK